jgi:hypothetical protein
LNEFRNKQDVAAEASRMTPKKFQCPHGLVKLANGLMITIDTQNYDDNYAVKIMNMPIVDHTRRLLQSYPGPLIRGVSHKKTVIEFCEDKLKHVNLSVDVAYRASYALLWSYLILMLRQNGTYTEADISELLMKNSNDFRRSYETSVSESKNVNSKNIDDDNVDDDDDNNNTDVSDSEENVSSERNSNTISQSQATESRSALTEKNVLDKFKDYLLYGNINDALDFATDNNLWGHALFLASKVDRRQHANVMLKFANKLPYNDPLQTLYQIMSGRMPSCVSNLDDKFGDWRPHLAMIISNCTDKPELVKRSIMALGDSLASRGDIYGSQFCYLLMDPQFTDYSDTTMSNGKIALLGTNVNKSFKEFASNESIILTEVYEYARSLSSENYFIASLQKYKYLLANNILDYGMQLKSLLYLEQISKNIVAQPDVFDGAFMMKVYALADRLKFYDPVMMKSYEDNFNNNETTDDPKWLSDLSQVTQSYSGISLQQNVYPDQQQNQNQQQQAVATPSYAANDVFNPMDYQKQPLSTGIYDPTSSQHQTPTHTVSTQGFEEHDSNVNQQNYSMDQNSSSISSQMPTMGFNQETSFNQYQQDQQQNQQNYNNYTNNNINNNSSLYQSNNENNINQMQSNDQQNFMQPTFDPNANANYQQTNQTDYGNYNWDQVRLKSFKLNQNS